MEYLEILDAQGNHRRIELNRDRLLIGREPTADVYLPHRNVSRRHAQMQRAPQGHWILQDLNSLNHVFIGDTQVQQVALEIGKEFRIADYRLTVLEASTVLDAGKPPVSENRTDWTHIGSEWLDHLHGFQKSLLRLDEARQVLERLADEVCRLVQPQLVAVGMTGGVAGQHPRWEVVMCPGGHPDQALLAHALECATGENSSVRIWTADATTYSTTPGPVPPMCLLFPMKGRSGIIGHLFVQQPRFSPTPPDVERYVALLAIHAGLVWDNLHLVALRSEHRQMEAELQRAREIQIGLFPPTFEVHEDLNAFAVNLPSVRVSGDYYDLFRTGPSTVAFVIADAMGHGMPAALMMAAVRAGLRMGLLLHQPWDKVFRGLDDIIRQAREGAFVTGIVGQLDFATHELSIVSAGHQLPSLLVGGKPIPLPNSCLTRPWGLDFNSPWQPSRVDLGTGGWSLLCYTDGITEGAERGERAFTPDKVAGYHLAHCEVPAEDLCQGLLSEAAERQATSSLADDQTVLVLRSVPTTSGRPHTMEIPLNPA